MSNKESKYYIYQQASLSQKVSHKDPQLRKLVGSDIQLSKKIANLLVLCQFGFLNPEDPSIKFLLALLDMQRKAIIAASEKTDILTKLGFFYPKADDEEDWSDE